MYSVFPIWIPWRNQIVDKKLLYKSILCNIKNKTIRIASFIYFTESLYLVIDHNSLTIQPNGTVGIVYLKKEITTLPKICHSNETSAATPKSRKQLMEHTNNIERH